MKKRLVSVMLSLVLAFNLLTPLTTYAHTKDTLTPIVETTQTSQITQPGGPQESVIMPYPVRAYVVKSIRDFIFEQILTEVWEEASSFIKYHWQKYGGNENANDSSTKPQVKVSGETFDPSLSSTWCGDGRTNNPLQVKALQQALTDLNYNPGGVDGYWGPKTKAALVSYQTNNYLVADGNCGPATWRSLASHK